MKNPFIAGNWVRGENFFGRQDLIQEVLDGGPRYMWITGTRRFGKTSVLKQLEALADQGEYQSRYLALFWAWQGAMDIDGFGESLLEACEDAEERVERLGISIDDLEGKSVFEILRLLKRRARQQNLTLMLLCDIVAQLPYSDIRDNLISSSMLPIDMLRCKLSFFGATKFDPRSDRWVRITMYQDAPFPDEIHTVDADDWSSAARYRVRGG